MFTIKPNDVVRILDVKLNVGTVITGLLKGGYKFTLAIDKNGLFWLASMDGRKHPLIFLATPAEAVRPFDADLTLKRPMIVHTANFLAKDGYLAAFKAAEGARGYVQFNGTGHNHNPESGLWMAKCQPVRVTKVNPAPPQALSRFMGVDYLQPKDPNQHAVTVVYAEEDPKLPLEDGGEGALVFFSWDDPEKIKNPDCLLRHFALRGRRLPPNTQIEIDKV